MHWCPDHFMHYQISIVLFCIACHRHQGQIFFSIQFQTMPASCSEPTRKVRLVRDKPAPYQKTPQASKTLKVTMGHAAIMELCCQLESVCISVPTESSFVVLEHLRRYRAELRREMILNAKQTTLDTFWNH